MTSKILISEKKLEIILNRLCHQLKEKHGDFSRTILVGIQPRGTLLLDRLSKILNGQGFKNLKLGKLDTTFFRDDYRRSETLISANKTEMNETVEGMNIVFIDDVLFTGRSIRSALTAIDSYGRPNSIELLVLIDRRFSRHLPIQPDYLGVQIDALQGDRVRVVWSNKPDQNIVYLEKSNE